MSNDDKRLIEASNKIQEAFNDLLGITSYTTNEIESAKLALTISINSIETELERRLIDKTPKV